MSDAFEMGMTPALTRAEFIARVDILATTWKMSETSGRRSAHYNALVGGHAESLHRLGLAVDLVPPTERTALAKETWWREGGQPTRGERIRRDMKRLGLFGKWHGEGDSLHLHVQAVPVLPMDRETGVA